MHIRARAPTHTPLMFPPFSALVCLKSDGRRRTMRFDDYLPHAAKCNDSRNVTTVVEVGKEADDHDSEEWVWFSSEC